MATRGWEGVTASGTEAPVVTLCRVHGLPVPVAEHRFHQTRRWRFDYAWPALGLALEVQGGLHVAGRHSRGPALEREHDKLNAAAAAGFRVVFSTPREVASGAVMVWLAPLLRPKE